MSKTQSKQTEEKLLADKVSDFLYANRKVIIGALVAIVIVAVVLVVGSIMSSSAKARSISEVEQILLDFATFKSENIKNASDELTDYEKQLLTEAEDKAIADLEPYTNKGDYAAFMASNEIAELYFSREDWQTALNYYERAEKSTSGKFISGASLFNGAVCLEQLGDQKGAYEKYLAASKVSDFPFVARSLFNAARLQESMDKETALALYSRVTAEFPNTEWSKLSKTRLIILGD